MKKVTLTLMAIAGLAVTMSAFASDDGWYMYGAAGQTSGSGDKPMFDHMLTYAGNSGFLSGVSTPTVYNLDIGYQINKNLAFEGGFIGSTNETYSASGGNLAGPVTASAKISGWTLAAVGMLPLANQLSLLGKLGVADIQDAAYVTGLSGPNIISVGGTSLVNGIKTDITFGVGVKYDFTHVFSVRLNLDSYNIGSSSSSSRCSVWTIGVGYKY